MTQPMPEAFPFRGGPSLEGEAFDAAIREASDLSAAYSNRLSSLTQMMSVAGVVIGIAATVGVANHESGVFLVVPFFLLTIAAYALMISADSTALIVARRQLEYDINHSLKARVLVFGEIQGDLRASTSNLSSSAIVGAYGVALLVSVLIAWSSAQGQVVIATVAGRDISALGASMAIAAIPMIAAGLAAREASMCADRTKQRIWESRQGLSGDQVPTEGE